MNVYEPYVSRLRWCDTLRGCPRGSSHLHNFHNFCNQPLTLDVLSERKQTNSVLNKSHSHGPAPWIKMCNRRYHLAAPRLACPHRQTEILDALHMTSTPKYHSLQTRVQQRRSHVWRCSAHRTSQTMSSRAQSSRAQHQGQDPEDDTNSSYEMLNTTKQPHHHTSERHPTSTQDHVHTPTLLQKLAPFPYRTTLILTLLPLSLTPLITLSVAAEVTSQSYIRGRDCYPNGLWKYSPTATWEIMDSSYFFTPNLSFGAMSFTQVKVIDIAWDLLVGRGGQLVLAWVNWRVFNEWLVWCAEGEGVGWRMYAAVSFETTSLNTLGVLGKESLCLEGRRWKRWVRWLGLVSMLLSTLYVLSFPTLMAALTGYIAKSEPYVQDYEGNLIAFGKVDGVRYVVHDAGRIGYDRALVVGERDEELVGAVRECTYLLLFLRMRGMGADISRHDHSSPRKQHPASPLPHSRRNIPIPPVLRQHHFPMALQRHFHRTFRPKSQHHHPPRRDGEARPEHTARHGHRVRYQWPTGRPIRPRIHAGPRFV